MTESITVVIVGVLCTGFLGWVAFVSKMLLKHATIMATLTENVKPIPQVQDDVRIISAQVAEVRALVKR